MCGSVDGQRSRCNRRMWESCALSFPSNNLEHSAIGTVFGIHAHSRAARQEQQDAYDGNEEYRDYVYFCTSWFASGRLYPVCRPERTRLIIRTAQRAATRCRVPALMYAILDDPIACVQKPVHNRRRQRLARESEDWIFADNEAWPFSLVHICAALGLDPDSVWGWSATPATEVGGRRSGRAAQKTRYTCNGTDHAGRSVTRCSTGRVPCCF